MRGDPRSAVEEPAQAVEEPEPALPLAQVMARRRRLELAHVDVTRQLERARAEAHREILQRALRALEEELDRLI